VGRADRVDPANKAALMTTAEVGVGRWPSSTDSRCWAPRVQEFALLIDP